MQGEAHFVLSEACAVFFDIDGDGGLFEAGDGAALNFGGLFELAVFGECSGEGVEDVGVGSLGEGFGLSGDFDGAWSIAEFVGTGGEHPGKAIEDDDGFGLDLPRAFEVFDLIVVEAEVAPALGAEEEGARVVGLVVHDGIEDFARLVDAAELEEDLAEMAADLGGFVGDLCGVFDVVEGGFDA